MDMRVKDNTLWEELYGKPIMDMKIKNKPVWECTVQGATYLRLSPGDWFRLNKGERGEFIDISVRLERAFEEAYLKGIKK